jgi:hypothetical protein
MTTTGFTLDTLRAAQALMPKEPIASCLACGQRIIGPIRQLPELKPATGMPNFLGIRVFVDDELPPNVAEFRLSDGTVVARLDCTDSLCASAPPRWIPPWVET